MKILLISRKSPQYSTGGMEQLSHHLIESLSALPDTSVYSIVWKHSQKLLPLFMAIAFLKGTWIGLRGVDLIHIGDAVLAPLGLIFKFFFGVPITIGAHGLDIVFPFYLYQKLAPLLLERYDRVICISHATYQECLVRGIHAERCRVIYPGTELSALPRNKLTARKMLSDRWGRDLSASKILVTVGRLVPRKGVDFFVRQVFSALVQEDSSFVYLVVGEGPERNRLMAACAESQVQANVILTGYLQPEILLDVYSACDLVVVPNVPQPNDPEGFGLVVIEAQAAGRPVLVSDLEGLHDTVPDEHRDWLVPPGDAVAWRHQIKVLFETKGELERRGEQARNFAAEQFTWSAMARQYLNVFAECARRRQS